MPKYKNTNDYPVNIYIRNDYSGLVDNILLDAGAEKITYYIIPNSVLPSGVVMVDLYPLDTVHVYSQEINIIPDTFYELQDLFGTIQSNITLSIKNQTSSIIKLWINNLFDHTNSDELTENLSKCIYIDANSEFKLDTHTSLIYALKFTSDSSGKVIINVVKNFNANY